MERVNILAVCSHLEILQTVVRLINNNPAWNGIGAANEEQATELLKEQRFDLVLLGSGMDNTSEKRIKLPLTAHTARVKFIQHYGGGSGLLSAEIYEALAQ